MQGIGRQTGFTLVEIAIVVLIVTILLGYTVALFPVQQELKQYRQLDRDLDRIVEHLIGFAQVNGRLPCPDTAVAPAPPLDGREDAQDLIDNATGAGGADGLEDDCIVFYGLLPAGTLGITGNLDDNGNLLDPWGQPYRYHVSNLDQGGLGAVDLISPQGVRDEGLTLVAPNLNLVICRDSNNPSAADTACPDVNDTIVANAAVVVYSSGKDQGSVASNIQDENQDGFDNGQADFVYTATTRSDVANAEYDDKVRWISPSLLFSKMIEAERLP